VTAGQRTSEVQYLEHHLELSRECKQGSQHGSHGHEHELKEQQASQVVHTRYRGGLPRLQPEQPCTQMYFFVSITQEVLSMYTVIMMYAFTYTHVLSLYTLHATAIQGLW